MSPYVEWYTAGQQTIFQLKSSIKNNILQDVMFMSSVHFSVSVTRYFSTASLIKRRSVQSKALGCVVVACCVYSPVQAAPDAGALLNQQERSQVAPAAPSTLHAPQITTPNIPFAGDGTNNTQTILLQNGSRKMLT